VSIYNRHMASALRAALVDTPVVCLLGPRQVGKTTLAQLVVPDRPYISFDDQNLVLAAQNDPVGFVRGLPEKVVLDEVQRVPALFPAIKAEVDKNRVAGRFLLTGSANLLLLPSVQESLAGRMEVVYLQPLSEMEKQGGKHCLLQDFIESKLSTSISVDGVVDGVAEAICGGGYPEPLGRSVPRARQWFRQYLNAVMQRDVREIAAIKDTNDVAKLMQMLAYRTANLLNVNGLANDLGMNRATVEKYLGILERLFLVRVLPAWHRNNASRLIKAPKVHVVDSGLASVLNNLNAEQWHSHSDTFGALLESFVVQQLICQAGWVDADLRFSHYRDKDQVEVDLVIERGRDVWAVEVKRASNFNEKDGAGLAKLAAQAGANFRGGMLFYTGASCLPLKQANCFAVPMNRLWQ
jgi:uncharacterized protein